MSESPKQRDAVQVLRMRVDLQAQTLDVLLRRVGSLARRCARMDGDIADLQAENVSLRQRVTELEHRCNDRQAAHNALVRDFETMARLVAE